MLPPTDFVVPLSDPARGHATLVVPRLSKVADLRVLHVVNGEHFSGAERVQSHLGRCLPRLGVEAAFACVKPGAFATRLRQQAGREGIGFETPMQNRFDLRVALQVRDLVREHGFQLLHAHTPRTALVTSIAARLSGVPWVYHVHSPASRDSDKRISNWFNAVIEQRSLRGCSHLITVSESLRSDCIAAGIDPDKVTVVHNGVPGVRPPRTRKPSAGGRWTIGMVALMRPRKGLEVLLDAIGMLERSGRDVVLRCIGPFETPEYRAEIDARIDQLGIRRRVEQVGFVDDVPAALATLDAMVLPSLFGEGLPMVVLEAMAAALPVIATRVEGTPEAITHGVEGLLAEPRSASSLAAVIDSLVSGQHDWNQLAEAAFRRHARCFSDLAMATGTAAVYRKLLSAA
jgi:glycosyltransferase involved in cell wall biosynthesis